MIGDLIEPRREPVGVLRPHRGQGAQDDEVQRPLQQLDALAVFTGHYSGENVPMPSLHCQVHCPDVRFSLGLAEMNALQITQMPEMPVRRIFQRKPSSPDLSISCSLLFF